MKTTFKLAFGLAFASLATSSYALTLEKTPHGPQTIPDNPQRIVVLDMGAADDLLVLGETGRVVGISQAPYLPKEISLAYNKAANVGPLNKPDFEAIAKLKPDLIVTSARSFKYEDKLKEIAPVLRSDIDYKDALGSVRQNALNWGTITNKEELAKLLISELDERVARANARIKDKTALIAIANDRKISAFGPVSRFGIIYQGGGFNFKPVDKNIKEDRHGQQISFEYLVEKNPQFIFIVDRTGTISDVKDNVEKTFDNDFTKKLQAYKNNAIYVVNGTHWYTGFGGLMITNSIVDEVNEALDKATYKK